MLQFAIGNDDFGEIRQKGFVFVDKSGLIQELLSRAGDKVTLITRPRRFGKTLNISMLHHFLAATVSGEPTHSLFEGLQITHDSSCMAHQGQYPVICFSLKGIKATSFESAVQDTGTCLRTLYKQYEYLLTSPTLSQDDHRLFYRIVNLEATHANINLSLQELSRWLHAYHGVKPWILIDEYDTPIQTAYLEGYYNDMIKLMQKFLGNALKTNAHFERAVLTGIVRASQESLFSDLNNVGVYTLFNEEYSENFGFTESEVSELLVQTGLVTQGPVIKDWYNGYLCGNTTLYNPWSIINCLSRKGSLQPYWVQTGGTAMIQDLLARADRSVKTHFEDLLSGKPIQMRISEHLAFGFLGGGLNAVMSLLLAAGYLKAISRTQERTKWLCSLQIPNHEVMTVFEECVLQWFASKNQQERYEGLLQALIIGDARTFTREMKLFFERTVSYFDASQQQPEKFYHGFVLGMVVSLAKTHTIESNRESGAGRYDVVLLPHDISQPGVIMEFKVAYEDETLQEAAEKALSQIKAKGYAATLHQRRITQVLALGLAFSGKQVTIQHEWLE